MGARPFQGSKALCVLQSIHCSTNPTNDPSHADRSGLKARFFFFLNQFISRYLLHLHTLDKDRPSMISLSDFPWILEFLNFEHTDRKRELSGPRPLRGVQVDSSKSMI